MTLNGVWLSEDDRKQGKSMVTALETQKQHLLDLLTVEVGIN